MDTIATKPPSKDYKPANAASAAVSDRAYIQDRLGKLCERFNTTLRLNEVRGTILTDSEEAYFGVLSDLAPLAYQCSNSPRWQDISPDSTSIWRLLQSLRAKLQTLGEQVHRFQSLGRTKSGQLAYNKGPRTHALFRIRDSALAITQTVERIRIYQEQDTTRDKTGRSKVPKEVTKELKEVEASATKLLLDVKKCVQMEQGSLAEPGWVDTITGWATAEHDTSVFEPFGGRSSVEEWAGRVLESWKVAAKGVSLL